MDADGHRELFSDGPGADYLLPALAGLLGFLGQFGVSKAFGRGDPLVPAAVQYGSVVFALVLDWTLFDRHLTGLPLLGMGLVIAAALATVVRGARAPATKLRR